MLALGFADWTFWEDYAPPTYLGGQKVVFDGPNKLILISEGELNINVRIDIYSAWKEYVILRDNGKYAKALTAIGGDPITDTTNVGITYFLENGWRIKPFETDSVITLAGNIFTRETGENPFIPVSGVTISLTRSNLVDFIQSSIDETAIDNIDSNITNILIPDNQLARDHARAANQQTQK